MCEDDEREQESKGNEKKMSVDRSRTMWACTPMHLIHDDRVLPCHMLEIGLIRLRAKVVGAEAGGLGVRGEMWGLVCSAAARAPSKRPVQNRATEQPTPERPATTVQFHTLVYHHFTHSLFIIASRSSPLPRPLVQDNSEWI
ncbi:hypothetical protein F5888DRAFT_1631928 [Russula emetica]|nr:hypothetical protein F5888DRAFT_1631928 [Russula emetica]